MLLLGALIKGEFIAPFTFQGGCNSEVFNAWLEEVLLPILPKEATLVMDNAAFHKSAKTKELIEKFGCHLLFLPTYSPDLNPIEHWWHKIKSILRPFIQQGFQDLHYLLDLCLST
ncbi:MAG: IS630 family transposase [Alphaproteobacteria bacterium]|nr:IS630 family transposase [Alphaproteobacteria bacterium]